MSLDIEQTELQGLPVLKIKGAVMELNIAQFSRALRTTAQRVSGAIVVDVSETEYLDSQALGLLVFYHSTLQSDGQRLIILNENSNDSSYMYNLFETTGLSKVLPVASSLEQLLSNQETSSPDHLS